MRVSHVKRYSLISKSANLPDGYDEGYYMDLTKHPTDETLEQYLFGALHGSEAESVEEHLLVCHSCIDAAEQLLAFMDSLRGLLEDEAPRARAAGGDTVLER